MPASFLIYSSLFIGTITGITLMMIRYRTFGLCLMILLAVSLPFLSDTSGWNNWFDWVKRYSVALPVTLWAWILWRASAGKSKGQLYTWIVRIFPIILVINIVEVSIKQFQSCDFTNSVFLALIALTTPFGWTLSSNQSVGFRDPIWICAFTTSLLYVYILDPTFKNVCFGANAVLLIAAISILVLRDSQEWFTWRAYTLALLIYQDSMYDSFSNLLYPPILFPESRILLRETAFEYGLLAITCFFVVLIIFNRLRRITLSLKQT